MKKIILILLLSTTCVVHAQMSDSLLQYYTYVNRAVNAICDSNYNAALTNYNKAFTYKKDPYGVDIYNTTVIYVLQKKHKQVYLNLKKLVSMGFSIADIKEEKYTSIFHDFFYSKYGKKIDDYAKHPDTTYNVRLRKTYDSLLVEDQFFRLKEGSYSIYRDTIFKIDAANVEIMNNLIEKYGFPSEQQVGIHGNFGYKPIWFIITHNNPKTKKENTFDYSEILVKAINDGTMNVKIAAELQETNLGTACYGISNYEAMYSYYIKDTNATKFVIPIKTITGYHPIKKENKIDIERINKERKAVGLPSIEEARKQSSFGIFSPFHITGRIMTMGLTQKQYDYRMKTFIPVVTP